MKKVFSKEKYFENMGRGYWNMMAFEGVPEDKRWQSVCDGKTVDECARFGYVVNADWLVEVDEEKEKKVKMTIQDFKEKNLAVVIKSNADLEKFLEMCNDARIRWASGDMASKYKPYFEAECYIVYDGRLTYVSDDDCAEEKLKADDYKIVDVSEFFADAEKPCNEYKIVITCKDGKTTKAQMYVNGKTVKGTEAHCNPEDKFRFSAGAKWAFNRLFEKKK